MDLGSERRPRKLELPRKSENSVDTPEVTEFFDKFEIEDNESDDNKYKNKEDGEEIEFDSFINSSRNEFLNSKDSKEIEPKERVVLNAMEQFKTVDNRINKANTPQDFFNIGREKGKIEGMIEGYIMAMFNVGMDLDKASKKLVLTFNITKESAESFLRDYYEKRNISFEEV